MFKRAAIPLFVLILLLAVNAIAQRKTPEMTVVKKYLNANDSETALSCLTEDYRIWFGKKEGEGVQRSEVENMLQWDFALNLRRPVQHCFEHPGRVTCQIHEENDFSRLIDFPGWDASTTFWINEDGLIMSQLYEPLKNQPDWRPYLDKALPWLKENKSEILAKIFPEEKLNQSSESARLWVEVLTEWRKAAGLPEISTK